MFNSDLTKDILKIPVADGGEGLVECLLASRHGDIIHTKVQDPLNRQIEGFYGLTKDHVAIIEMAAASGLPLLKKSERDPMKTTTYGDWKVYNPTIVYPCNPVLAQNQYRFRCP